MSTRTKTRTPAQVQMANIMTMYIEHMMQIQGGCFGKSSGVEYELPNNSFPSFDFFCAEFAPSISLEKYVQRLVTYMKCSAEAFIFALAYIRHLLTLGFPLHSRSIHRVVLTSMVVAAKTRDDLYCSMSYYAQVGGVSKSDLNMMELRFLVDLLDFRTEVSPEQYREVCRAITLVESMKRVASNTSELCGATASNTPTESEKSPVDVKPQWITDCQLYW